MEGAIPSIFPGPKYLSKIIGKPPVKYSIIDVKDSNSNTTSVNSDMPVISQDSIVNDGKL